VSLEKQQPSLGTFFEEPQKIEKPPTPPLTSDLSEEASVFPQSEWQQETMEKLGQEERDLRADIRRITSELKEVNRETAQSADKRSIQETKDHTGQMKHELEGKKEALRKVQFDRFTRSQAELLRSINEGLQHADEVPVTLVNALYNGHGDTEDSRGNGIDLTV
jgi:hypothetical protein